MTTAATTLGKRSLIALLCIVIAGCGEPAAAPAQGGAQTPSTGTADAPAGSAPPAAQATEVPDPAVARAAASAASLNIYRVKAGIALQDYANALGALRDNDREAGDLPALISDAAWLGGTTTAMQLMQASADRLTAIAPIPPEMASTALLLRQIEDDTRLLNRAYGLGVAGASPAAVAAAGRLTIPLLDLLGQANRELRRGQA